MVDSTNTSPDQWDHQAELKQQLVRRVAVAGVIALILLAALAIFDQVLQPDAPRAGPRTLGPPIPAPASSSISIVRMAFCWMSAPVGPAGARPLPLMPAA